MLPALYKDENVILNATMFYIFRMPSPTCKTGYLEGWKFKNSQLLDFIHSKLHAVSGIFKLDSTVFLAAPCTILLLT
jgi:hypothetical protein